MRHFTVTLLVILLLQITATHAQREYWGVTQHGGNSFHFDTVNGIKEGMGNIFKTDKHGHNVQLVHSFDSATGFDRPYTLTQAGNGNLYGLTAQFGISGDSAIGSLYELNPVTGSYTVKHIFTYPYGFNFFHPTGRLLYSKGKLYGFRYTRNNNTIYYTLYSLDLTTNVLTDIKGFSDGASLYQEMTEAANGHIYITFQYGAGVGYQGVLYDYNPANNVVTKRYEFADLHGSQPYGAMIEYSPGIFYGCVTDGSGFIPGLSKGGIYEFNANTNTYTMKARMDSINGSNPYCNLVRVGDKLYGTTNHGGLYNDYGILFEYNPVTSILKKIYDLGGQLYVDPILPNGYFADVYGQSVSLFAQDSLLFGLTQQTIFSFNPYTGQFNTLEPLTAWKGRDAVGSLTMTCTKPYYAAYITDTIHVLQGQPLSFTIHTPNTDTFHWVKDSTNVLTAQKDSSLHIANAQPADQGWYTCRLRNECGDSITKKVFLKVDVLTPLGLQFTAQVQDGKALLQWQSEAAGSIAAYNIERSADGRTFTNIATQPAIANRYSFNYTDYEFITIGKAWYRIKEQAKDGSINYSRTILLTTHNSLLTITPNPAKDKVVIAFGKTVPYLKLEWIAANGQVVQTNEYKNTRQHTVPVSHLPAGVYMLQVTTPGMQENRQVVIEK